MPKINLVKAIVRYRPSVNPIQKFRYGSGKDGGSFRYLLLQKTEDQHPENIGKWECPGGKLKSKETSLEALTREMTEELPGLIFRIIKQLPTIKNCDVYLIDTASMNIKLSSEHSDYQWKKAEEVKNMDLVAYADLLLEFFNNPKKYLE